MPTGTWCAEHNSLFIVTSRVFVFKFKLDILGRLDPAIFFIYFKSRGDLTDVLGKKMHWSPHVCAICVCLQQLILIRNHHQAHTCPVFFVIADTSLRSDQKLVANEIIEVYNHVIFTYVLTSHASAASHYKCFSNLCWYALILFIPVSTMKARNFEVTWRCNVHKQKTFESKQRSKTK